MPPSPSPNAAAPSASPSRHTLSVLSANIQAGSSTQAYREYVSRSWSHVLPAGKRDNLAAIARTVAPFDIVGLQESDPGSMRSGFNNQTRVLAEAAHFPFWSHQPNRSIARIAGSANGLLSRMAPTEVLDYPLPGRIAGRGVLMARYGGDDGLTVAVAHLSLGAQSRHAQLAFLAELLGDAPHAVLMGDFNCHHEAKEMQVLYRRTRLEPPACTHLTFPSWRPARCLDHILIGGVACSGLRTLVAGRSDHLAIAVDIEVDAHLVESRPAARAAGA
ncbi:endonuclease/exonuclease/phosphatase family protein [Coralloluteibacterium thermophilus]|uniref:Endonuclease/exonuclease/phosphatase family protein n=1 Tax=Coralloluteibacterium thermophilum TaxID=2707049 RepID=A0ABV9NL87_9GAMM